MNERIRELVRQAVISVDIVTGNEALDDELAKMYIPDCFSEKFAELIVRECVEIALEQKKWVEDMKVHNPHDEVWNKARIQQSQHIVDQIEKHFGVEE
jgi:hypothetical protein